MCPPKPPAIPATPQRQSSRLPDNGDASIASRARQSRRVGPGAMILANANGTLGLPMTTNPLGK